MNVGIASFCHHRSRFPCHLEHSFIHSFTNLFISNCFILIMIVVQGGNTPWMGYQQDTTHICIHIHNLSSTSSLGPWSCELACTTVSSHIWNNWAMPVGGLATVKLPLGMNKYESVCAQGSVDWGPIQGVSILRPVFPLKALDPPQP